MDHDVALGTVDVVLQMLHDAALAEGVETLGDGGGVHQVAGADLAGDHLVDGADVDPALPARHRRDGRRCLRHRDARTRSQSGSGVYYRKSCFTFSIRVFLFVWKIVKWLEFTNYSPQILIVSLLKQILTRLYCFHYLLYAHCRD